MNSIPEMIEEEQSLLSDVQARAILDMRLRTLTGLERDKLKQEYDELMQTIAQLKEILNNRALRFSIIEKELSEIKEKYGDARRTEIIYSGDDLRVEDMIADDDVLITISHMGYIKRTLLSEYKTQGRGGKGSKGGANLLVMTATPIPRTLLMTHYGDLDVSRLTEKPAGRKPVKTTMPPAAAMMRAVSCASSSLASTTTLRSCGTAYSPAAARRASGVPGRRAARATATPERAVSS